MARPKGSKNSFHAWHDEMLRKDDTHKFTKKIYVNTAGRSRARPYTAMETLLSKAGKIVAAVLKFTKSHAESLAIANRVKKVRNVFGSPRLKVLWTDDPKGEEGPIYEVFGDELNEGTTPFEKVSELPKVQMKR